MIKAYLQLGRIEFAGFLFGVMLSGALCIQGSDLHLLHTWPLAAIAILTNVWGFAHNDLHDLRVDRLWADLSDRPLVSGKVSTRGTIILIVACITATVIVTASAIPGRNSIMVLLSSMVLGGAYNVLSKRIPGMDVIFAGSTALLCSLGALWAAGASDTLCLNNPLLMSVIAIYFLDHTIFNAGATLKDVPNDTKAGAQTIAIAMGVRISEQNRLIIPTPFKCLLLIIKAISLIVFMAMAWALFPINKAILALGIFVMAGISFYLTMDALHLNQWDRKEIGRRWIMQEAFCKLLPPLLLLPVAGVYWFIFLITVPFLWFFLALGWIHRNPFKLNKGF